MYFYFSHHAATSLLIRRNKDITTVYKQKFKEDIL